MKRDEVSRTVWTRHYDGVSNAEIAEELGILEAEVANMIQESKDNISYHFLRKLGWVREDLKNIDDETLKAHKR